MPQFIKATVRSKEGNRLILRLPDGKELEWSADPEHIDIDAVAVGDELTLTLSRSVDLLNELLKTDDGEE